MIKGYFKTFQVYSSFSKIINKLYMIAISKLFKFIVHIKKIKEKNGLTLFQNFSSL